MIRNVKVSLVLCIIVFAGAGFIKSGHTAIFDVSSATDLGDSNPGDGVCSASGPFCTLRAAVEEANALGGSHTINLPAGDYILILGTLTLSVNIDLAGDGDAVSIIDGNNESRIFVIDSNASITISGVTIQNGRPATDHGGGIVVGTGCTLSLEDVAVSGNVSTSRGGGIFNEGILTITRSTLSGNLAEAHGGAIRSENSLTATEVVVSGNTALIGGGFAINGSIELTDVTFSGNEGTGDITLAGGGIFLNVSSVATFNRVTFANNVSMAGGGIYGMGTDLTMTNVTMTNNFGLLGGGAIRLSGYEESDITMTNVTISGNIDNGNGGGAISFNNTAATVAIVNTIFADNGTSQCDSTTHIFSFGHNLETTNTCGLTAVGDQVNTSANLGVLADNGGFTRTMALLPGSPAIDAGDDLPAPAADQRGVSRPQDGDSNGTAVTDIGAFEVIIAIFHDGFESGDVSRWSAAAQ